MKQNDDVIHDVTFPRREKNLNPRNDSYTIVFYLVIVWIMKTITFILVKEIIDLDTSKLELLRDIATLGTEKHIELK